MNPYYEYDAVTLYCGDAQEIALLLDFDCVVRLRR